MYVRHVKTSRIHLFTLIQVLALAVLWVIKSFKETSIFFPIMVRFIQISLYAENGNINGNVGKKTVYDLFRNISVVDVFLIVYSLPKNVYNREVKISLRRVRERNFCLLISCYLPGFLFVIVVVDDEMEAMSRSPLCVQKHNENDSNISLSFSFSLSSWNLNLHVHWNGVIIDIVISKKLYISIEDRRDLFPSQITRLCVQSTRTRDSGWYITRNNQTKERRQRYCRGKFEPLNNQSANYPTCFHCCEKLAWSSGCVTYCHATARGSIPGGNSVKPESHVLRKGQEMRMSSLNDLAVDGKLNTTNQPTFIVDNGVKRFNTFKVYYE